MDESLVMQLESPCFVESKALLIAGLRESYTAETRKDVVEQWQRFGPLIGKVPGQVGRTAYGVWFNVLSNAASFDCLTGVEVSDFSALPAELSRVRIPAQTYAVFRHREHVSKLWITMTAIGEWFPGSGYEIAHESSDAPDFFERYGEGFDPRTGIGDIEVWVPVKPLEG